MVCKNCGRQNDAAARFCYTCGGSLQTPLTPSIKRGLQRRRLVFNIIGAILLFIGLAGSGTVKISIRTSPGSDIYHPPKTEIVHDYSIAATSIVLVFVGAGFLHAASKIDTD